MIKLFRNLFLKTKIKIRNQLPDIENTDLSFSEEESKEITDQGACKKNKKRNIPRKKGKDRIVNPPKHKPIKRKPD